MGWMKRELDSGTEPVPVKPIMVDGRFLRHGIERCVTYHFPRVERENHRRVPGGMVSDVLAGNRLHEPEFRRRIRGAWLLGSRSRV